MRGAKPQLVIDNGGISQAPAAPSWMSRDAKAEWRRVLPILLERRILTTADLGSLENYCIAIGQIREMERLLQKEGQIVSVFKEDGEGKAICLGMKRHPAVGVQADAMTRSRLLAAELGLTPVSRSRPSIREEGDGDGNDPLNVS